MLVGAKKWPRALFLNFTASLCIFFLSFCFLSFLRHTIRDENTMEREKKGEVFKFDNKISVQRLIQFSFFKEVFIVIKLVNELI